jgi:hypothetical protein
VSEEEKVGRICTHPFSGSYLLLLAKVLSDCFLRVEMEQDSKEVVNLLPLPSGLYASFYMGSFYQKIASLS